MSSSGYRGKFTEVKTAKKRKSSSTRWLKRQLNDPYVAKSKLDGYKSRAAYKLIEINNKFHILDQGANIVDLGAAPGGWSQVAAKIIKSDSVSAKNKLIAIDLLEMEKIAGVISFQKDFFDEDTKDLSTNQHSCNLNLPETLLPDQCLLVASARHPPRGVRQHQHRHTTHG